MSSFYHHFNWITLAQNLSASEKTLCFALLKHLNSEDTCWPSKKLLAEETGLSTRHIRRLVKSLVEKEVLECTPRTPGRTTSNLYKLLPPSKTEKENTDGKTNVTPSSLPKRNCSSGQDDTSDVDIMSIGSGQDVTRGMDRMSLGEWTECLSEDDRMSWGG